MAPCQKNNDNGSRDNGSICYRSMVFERNPPVDNASFFPYPRLQFPEGVGRSIDNGDHHATNAHTQRSPDIDDFLNHSMILLRDEMARYDRQVGEVSFLPYPSIDDEDERAVEVSRGVPQTLNDPSTTVRSMTLSRAQVFDMLQDAYDLVTHDLENW